RAADLVEAYAGRTIRGMEIATVVESEPAGTAGALALAADHLDPQFFLVNGDSLFDFNWLALLPREGENGGCLVRMALAGGIAGDRYGRVAIEGAQVREFVPSGPSGQPINAGVYLMRREVMGYITSVPCSLERDVLPVLARQGLVQGIVLEAPFI